MGEHLDTDKLTGRAFDALGQYCIIDFPDLAEIQFAGQHDHVCELGVEFQGFRIGNAELGGNVDFHPDLTAIHYCGHVGGNDSVHAGFLRGIQCPAGRFKIFLIQDNVQCQIGLDPVFPANPDDFIQVFRLEVVG